MGGGRDPSIAPWLLLFLALSVVVAAEDRVNKSSLGRIFWATGKDESDLLTRVESSSDDDELSTTVAVEDETDEFAGGFPSLDGMLQWAIGHSDPVKLKEKANDIHRLSANELKKRQLEIKEFMERLKMPSDAELMKIAIDDLNNSSLSSEDRQRALNELLILVESIDNANDIDKLGGLVAVVRELYNSEIEIRTISAWVLGKASQNNALVQNQILALGALTRLMKMARSNSTEEAIKALYAISALIRSNVNAQDLFYLDDGNLLLQDIMSNTSIDNRIQKKAALLVADLADHQLENNADNAVFPFLRSRAFLKSLVDLTSSQDLDLQEKVLLTIRSLLKLASIEEALDFKDYCGLDGVLERMKEQLERLMSTAQDDEQRDYAGDMEGIRREVDIIFNRKIEEGSMVPT